MPDIIDEANDMAMMEMQSVDIRARLAAARIPKGVAGVCSECGEHSPRLVYGKCAPCRDEVSVRKVI